MQSGEQLRMHGLVISSDFVLNHARTTSAPAEFFVRRGPDRVASADVPAGEVLAQLNRPDGGGFYTLVQNDGGFVLRFHEICDIELDRDVTTAVCFVDPNGPVGIMPVIVSGILISIVLCLRDALVLHASAVEIDGSAVAFVGESGMGKSTLATWMCIAGGRLITDDVLRVQPAQPTVCWLGATESRLRPAASSLATDFGADLTRQTADERLALSVPLATLDPVPLRAVLVPQPDREAIVPSISWLGRGDALIVLSAFPRVLGWASPRVLGQQFGALGELVRRVPVGIARVPWGPPFDPQVPAQLLAQLAELGSADRPVG
ncbi:MAG: hypothetical protein ABI912_04980 [Actinomycetota bacterium]